MKIKLNKPLVDDGVAKLVFIMDQIRATSKNLSTRWH